MNEDTSRLRQEDLALLGRVGADVSHEMRNVLSVIGEYAGLLDDVLGLAESGKPPDYERLRKVAASIARQVKKGTETMERFSRFAHATDEPTASFDLAALVANTAALAQRRITLAGRRLETDFPQRAVPARANAFGVQQAICSAVELILESSEGGERVSVGLTTRGPAALIRVCGDAAGGGDELSGRISRLSDVMDDLKGGLETLQAEEGLSLVLTIPLA